MDDIRSVRILIKYQNTIKKLFKLAFTKKDASLYLFPYGTLGNYYYGGSNMKENQIEQTITYTEDYEAAKIPKLSIHQSGQVHIYYKNNKKAGPISTLPLKEWRGQHLATVIADSFKTLDNYKRKIKNNPPEVDHIIACQDKVENGKIVVYCNGNEPSFSYKCGLVVRVKREKLKRPIYFGFAPISAEPLTDGESQGGVTVISGWNPKYKHNQEQDFLYIRAQ